MFDEVTKVEGGKRAARKGAYIFGSTVFQVVFVAALVLVGERIRSAAKAEASVEVKFVRTAPPPPPPPPPAAKKRTEPKPKTDAPKTVMPPAAMIQPKEIAQEMKAPNPNEPPEPEIEADEGGSQGGVVGGVAGGIEEAPRYVGAGFRAPREKERGCIQSSMRVPTSLAGFVSGPITVKFAVRRDGSIGQLQVMSQIPDPRIGDIIRQGLSRCEFVPGVDAQGNPTALWVIMPIRFTSG